MASIPSRETLAEALASWDRAAVGQQLAAAEKLRAQFLERFPREGWSTMPVEEYGLGQGDNLDTACYWLEFKTRAVCSMSGGSAAKHLIYYSMKDAAWRHPKVYGSVEEAWNAVRAGFVETLRLAGEGRFDEVDDVPALAGSAALRSKTLIMYFPDELLRVTSKNHIEHFLRILGAPANEGGAVRANRQLLDTLQQERILADLSLGELSDFLYHWADPRSSVSVVKIAPGEQAAHWLDCRDGKIICIGWDAVGDLNEFDKKEDLRAAFREHYPYNGNESQVTKKAAELWTLMELQPGDKVIANRGISEVLAVGTVNGEGYRWAPERPEYKHTLGVDWDTGFARTIPPEKRWATTTVSKVPDALYRRIVGSGPAQSPLAIDPVYAEIEEALIRRGQVIIYGPPGTGKTYTARRAAAWLLAGGSAGIPDAASRLADTDLVAEEARFSPDGQTRANTWFMVANPGNWKWSQLQDEGGVDYSLGRLQRNFPMVRAGDLVVGYESSPIGRIVALARVTGEFDPDGDPEAALHLEPLASVANGPSWTQLQADPVLAESEPIRNRCQGSLFALSLTEAEYLLRMLVEKDRRLADVIASGGRRLTRVTFHPSYSYEDFVEGYRPVPSSTGQLDLRIADGLFKTACAAATADPGNPHILLIDEINRGNIPKVFGELITLLEKDKRGLSLQLPQSRTSFSVPPNLWIIGTMNTADRSVHLLDTALRRRFAFVELMPDGQVLQGATVGPLSLEDFLVNLNSRLLVLVGREKQLGHAIFFDAGEVVSAPSTFAGIFKHELLPMLQEYLFEDYQQLADLLGDDVIDRSTQRPTSLLDDGEKLCAALATQFGASAGS